MGGQRVITLALVALISYEVTPVAIEVDMSSGMVDDQFNQCREQMLKEVLEGGLLRTELNTSTEFQRAWNKASCANLIPGGRSEHTKALVAYGKGGKSFRQTFNGAVQSKGSNASVYANGFRFKSLHFLLMDALRLLRAKECHTVFRGSVKEYKVQPGSEVRFGRFTGAKSKFSEAFELIAEEEKGTLFSINSCSVVNIVERACHSEIDNLISPVEVFKVLRVQEVKAIEATYTLINLTSAGMHSDHDCYLFSRSPTTLPPPTTPAGSTAPLLSSTVMLLLASYVAFAFPFGESL